MVAPGLTIRPTQLTLELVPRTCWFRNVRSEVSPSDWRKLRSITLQKAGHRCEVCAVGGRLECHEVWAYDDDQHVQSLTGLAALCSRCHEVKHFGLAGVRGKRERAMWHLARVNGWSRGDVESYVEVTFETWHRRSQQEWTLDIAWLEQRGVTVREKSSGNDAVPADSAGISNRVEDGP